MSSCLCVGPQNGEPLCPCRMRGLVKRNGRWIKPEEDLGPVKTFDEQFDHVFKYETEEYKRATGEKG